MGLFSKIYEDTIPQSTVILGRDRLIYLLPSCVFLVVVVFTAFCFADK